MPCLVALQRRARRNHPTRFGKRAPSFSLNVEPQTQAFRFEATRSVAARQDGSFSCARPQGSGRSRLLGGIVVLSPQTGTASACGTRPAPAGENQSAPQTPVQSAELENAQANVVQASGWETGSRALDTGRPVGTPSSWAMTGQPAEDAAERYPASSASRLGYLTIRQIFGDLVVRLQVHATPKAPKPTRYRNHRHDYRSAS